MNGSFSFVCSYLQHCRSFIQAGKVARSPLAFIYVWKSSARATEEPGEPQIDPFRRVQRAASAAFCCGNYLFSFPPHIRNIFGSIRGGLDGQGPMESIDCLTGWCFFLFYFFTHCSQC